MSYPNYKYGTGLSNVGSYQVSGKPFVTGNLTAPASGSTPLKIEFPSVTRWITITSTANQHIRFGFSEKGVENGGNNYFIIHQDAHPMQNGPYELKVTELYILSDNGTPHSGIYVMAGLTGIPVERINNISPSGSNWSGSIGVG
jgi:hypothetical protein